MIYKYLLCSLCCYHCIQMDAQILPLLLLTATRASHYQLELVVHVCLFLNYYSLFLCVLLNWVELFWLITSYVLRFNSRILHSSLGISLKNIYTRFPFVNVKQFAGKLNWLRLFNGRLCSNDLFCLSQFVLW